MKKKGISRREYSAALVLTLLGGAITGAAGSAAGGNAWLCCLIAAIPAVLFLLMLSLMTTFRPGSGFFATMGWALGKGLGRLFALLMALVALRLTAHEMTLFGEFVSAALLNKTPVLVVTVIFAAMAALSVIAGHDATVRWAELALPPLGILLLLALALSSVELQPSEVAEALESFELQAALRGSLNFFSSSFSCAVACAPILFAAPSPEKPGLSLYPLLGAALLLTLTYLWNTSLLGAGALTLFNAPTYHALRVIAIGSLPLRMEVLLTLPLLLLGFFRATLLLAFARRGFSHAWKRRLGTVPVIILTAAALVMSFTLVKNQAQLRIADQRLELWTILAFVALPAAAAAVGVIRKKFVHNKSVDMEAGGG